MTVTKNRILVWAAVVAALVLASLVVSQFFIVQKAHSTFENYYAFRGCTSLLERTDTYGICTTNAGQTIKIVNVGGKWYLDGDLPVCYFDWCI